mmetsp:Transcript_43532/g.124132  ORF Transcript_43532/g.124132 Transcript_43532/m.124132 type:complete len:271 (+) Transcript_43532:452-1264(+)
MSGVWKPPLVFSTLACRAPAFSVSSFSAKIAASEPATEKPLGKSSLAIWQTAPSPSLFAASWASFTSLAFSNPATDSIACLLEDAASAMYWPRSFTSSKPSSKVNTPATQSAVYSPSDRPATTWQRSTASALSLRSFSTPARPAMNMAGWHFEVSSSVDSGPSRHSFSTSQPRIFSACISISFTLGMSFTAESIFTYCEPWPGKRSPTGIGFRGLSAATARAAWITLSSRSSGSGREPPNLAGSRPCSVAAPGRPMNQPLAGFLPHSNLP